MRRDEERQARRHDAALEARLFGGVGARGQPHRPVEVGHDDGGNQSDAGHRHQEGDEHLEGGQHEHEEGDVQPELWVHLAKGGAIEELEERLPLGGQAGTVREPEEQGYRPKCHAANGFEGLLIPSQRRRRLAAHRGGTVSVGVGHRTVHHRGCGQETDREQADVRPPLGEDDAGGAHLAVPQDLRPHDGSRVDNGAQGNKNDERDRCRTGLAGLHARGGCFAVSWWPRPGRARERKRGAHGIPLCCTGSFTTV